MPGRVCQRKNQFFKENLVRMGLAAIMAVCLTAVAMIMVAVMVLVMIVVAIVVICHKMFLIGGCMFVTLITIDGVHMGYALGVGMGFGLSGGTAAGSAKHANYGKKEKQLFHGFSVKLI